MNLVPSLQTGNEFQEALPLVNKEEAEPLTMVSQPLGWERGNTRLWTYLSAIPTYLLRTILGLGTGIV
ncbi:MAG: hypothetical protein V7K35_13625 [Nostoc sp.]